MSQNKKPQFELIKKWSVEHISKDPTMGLATIMDTMNELMADIFYQSGKPPFQVPWQPDVDMWAENDRIFIQIVLPGGNQKQLKLHVTSNLLIVGGKIEPFLSRPGCQVLLNERKTGVFSRSIPLPYKVEPEGITAEFERGVLSVSIPLAKKKKGIKINIE